MRAEIVTAEAVTAADVPAPAEIFSAIVRFDIAPPEYCSVYQAG